MSFSRLTSRQLDTFVAAAELLNFNGAGVRLGLSASAVSQLIAELELTVGFRLFDRTTRKVVLTTSGRDFLPIAEKVLAGFELARSAAEDIRNRRDGVVRVAAPLIIASTLLPSAIESYSAARPDIKVRIVDASVEGLPQAVGSGRADLAIGPDRMVDPDVERITLRASPWCLFFAPGHAFVALPSVRWQDVRREHLIASGRDHERTLAGIRDEAPDFPDPASIDYVDNVTTALGMAARGLGVTLAPDYVAGFAALFGLEMRPVVDPGMSRELCLYRSTVRSPSPAVQAFSEHLASSIGGEPAPPAGARPA